MDSFMTYLKYAITESSGEKTINLHIFSDNGGASVDLNYEELKWLANELNRYVQKLSE